jgi:hypothetical protein
MTTNLRSSSEMASFLLPSTEILVAVVLRKEAKEPK